MGGSGSVGVGGSGSISSLVNPLITVWKGIVFFVDRHICNLMIESGGCSAIMKS